jgi:hypothetical protein
MRINLGWCLTAAFSLSPPVLPPMIEKQQQSTTITTSSASLDLIAHTSLHDSVSLWLSSSSTPPPPSAEDVKLLRAAFAEFYGVNRDLFKSEELLTRALQQWSNQAPDELASLYRVRGDCRMFMADAPKAQQDYDSCIKILTTTSRNDDTSKEELPAAYLGRARAIKAQKGLSTQVALSAAEDYKQALKLSSREEWDTDQEMVEDGASKSGFLSVRLKVANNTFFVTNIVLASTSYAYMQCVLSFFKATIHLQPGNGAACYELLENIQRPLLHIRWRPMHSRRLLTRDAV